MTSKLGRCLMWTSPVVLALFAPLSMLSANASEVEPSVAARAIVASGILGLSIAGAFQLLVRPTERAAVLASATVIAIFSYGHVYDGLKELGGIAVQIARHRYLVPGDVLLVLGLAFLLIRRPTLATGIARWLTISAWILIVFPTVSLMWDQVPVRRSDKRPETGSLVQVQAAEEEPPDVFYVILDGYGREDVLTDSYGFDNSSFLSFLRRRGFYVAERATSNYSQTLLSLASSMNMDYLDALLDKSDFDRTDPKMYSEMMQASRAVTLFRNLGYLTVAFATGYHPTQLRDADVYLTPDYLKLDREHVTYIGTGLNDFEGLFLQTTMAAAVFDAYLVEIHQMAPGLIDQEYDKHRMRVLFTISSLSDIVARPGPHFVFAHVVSPHPPFVFGSRGEYLTQEAVFSLEEHACCEANVYVEQYTDQMQYLNKALEIEIDEILNASAGEAIIILQGDHGPAALLDWEKPSEEGIHDRMAILNAYYFPDAAYERLYPAISPVNTFRVIFNTYFGGDFRLLGDVSYFTSTPRLSDATRVAPPQE